MFRKIRRLFRALFVAPPPPRPRFRLAVGRLGLTGGQTIALLKEIDRIMGRNSGDPSGDGIARDLNMFSVALAEDFALSEIARHAPSQKRMVN